MATRETPIIIPTTATIPASKFGEFKPVVGTTGTILYTLKTETNHSDSMKLLEESDLRPLKYPEILSLLMRDETLKNSLKGQWFYLEGKVLDKKSELYTIDEKEKFAERKGDVSFERTVRVWNGTNPLSLVVFSDVNSAVCDRRFGLDASNEPHNAAPVVIGVPKLEPELSQTKAPSWLVSLRKTADLTESSVARLEETINPKLLAPVKELIRKVRRIELKE